MVLIPLLPALRLLLITRRQFRRLQMLHLMRTKILNLYLCTFTDGENNRLVRVVAPSFGQAASIANSIASGWEDHDRFELCNIELHCIVSAMA